MTLVEALNLLAAVTAIGISLYALRVAKRHQVQSMDHDMAAMILVRLRQVEDSFGDCDRLSASFAELEKVAEQPIALWGKWLEHCVYRLGVLVRLYIRTSEAGEDITQALYEDIDERISDIKGIAQPRIDALRGPSVKDDF